MQEDLEKLEQSVIHYRRLLSEAEERRAKYKKNIPSEIWQKFYEISEGLEKAESRVNATSDRLVGEVNKIRQEIMRLLQQYNHWREKMRHIEILFLVNIVRPGQHLKQAIRQREQLEQEYQRIHQTIRMEGYCSLTELEEDIRQVLVKDDQIQPENGEEEKDFLKAEIELEMIKDMTVVDIEESISQEDLARDFKRVVLPRVHPDTSNTPEDIFNSVYEVYKKGDRLLMEAYIIEYRGEVQPEASEEPLEKLHKAWGLFQKYQRLASRLRRRVEHLLQDLTKQELEHPEKIEMDMRHQRQEILDRIKKEGEQILVWREKIEGLTRAYKERHPQRGNNG